jgi:hypothetical protein
MEKCINKQIKLVSKLSKLTFRYCADDFSGKKFEWIFFFTSTNRTVKIRRNQAIFTLIAWSAVPVQSTARCTTDSILAFRLEAVL